MKFNMLKKSIRIEKYMIDKSDWDIQQDKFKIQLDNDEKLNGNVLDRINVDCDKCRHEEDLVIKLNNDRTLTYHDKVIRWMAKRERQPRIEPSDYCFLCTKPTSKHNRTLNISESVFRDIDLCNVHIDTSLYRNIHYICNKCMMFMVMQQHKLKYFKEINYIKEKDDKHETRHVTIYKIGE